MIPSCTSDGEPNNLGEAITANRNLEAAVDQMFKSAAITVPKTNRESEQGGADQPATAPQLKPEGDSKPQPKSGLRSQ